MNKIFNYMNKILFYGLFITGFIYLFFSINITLAISCFFSLLCSWVLSIILKKKGLKDYDLFVNLSIWGGILGMIYFYQHGFPFFDKILHFSIGLFITVLVYNNFKKNLKVTGDMVFFSVLGMLALWEIFEYILQTYFGYVTMGVTYNGTIIQSALDDTLFDLIMGSIGALTYLMFKREHLQHLSKKKRK